MFYGLLDLSWWHYLVVTFVTTHITLAGITIFLHRCQAHRALTLHPVASHFFRAWLWLMTGMETKAWVAVHRKHHAKAETVEDPHSPQVYGLKTVLCKGAELYRYASKNPEILNRYGHGTPDDWLERHIYSKYSAKGILLTLIVNIVLMGIPGILVWCAQMATAPFLAAGIINGVAHYWGYRNFECPDAATNISPFAFFIAGEELHNNHHTYPTSAKMSVNWWEFDIGWIYIKLMSFVGLAKIKRTSPKVCSIPNKHTIDAQALQDIIFNRIAVLSEYGRSVMLPILQQEMASDADNVLSHRIKGVLLKNDRLLDNQTQSWLEEHLSQNEALKQVYQLRQKLQYIWEQTTASQKELLEALHEWCAKAEATGIKSLVDFAAHLRGYKLSFAH